MSPKSATTARVRSTSCTHVLPDLGLELPGGTVTDIPIDLLPVVLQLDGVEQIHDKE